MSDNTYRYTKDAQNEADARRFLQHTNARDEMLLRQFGGDAETFQGLSVARKSALPITGRPFVSRASA